MKGPIKLVAASPLSMCDERQIEPIITNGDVISKVRRSEGREERGDDCILLQRNN